MTILSHHATPIDPPRRITDQPAIMTMAPTPNAHVQRALVAANHLKNIAGSEVVALEMTDHLHRSGYAVTVYASIAEPPMSLLIANAGGHIVTDTALIRPFAFDVVYAQHQLLGLFDYAPSQDDRESTLILLGRLSRKSYMESGGWLHDRLLADMILANSEMTAAHLREIGQTGPIHCFHNAAPAAFFAPARALPTRPARILTISSHRDPDLMGALNLLRQECRVQHIGRSGDREELVTPAMIAQADLVISIGKSIPYALAGRTPIYVYDHFGGPGYLHDGNRDAAARFNFTGRCQERHLPAASLAADILENYAIGAAFAHSMPDAWLTRYLLPHHLDQALAVAPQSNAARRVRMAAEPFLVQERMLATHIHANVLKQRRLERQIHTLKQDLNRAAAALQPA
jgi:hypothetical protein